MRALSVAKPLRDKWTTKDAHKSYVMTARRRSKRSSRRQTECVIREPRESGTNVWLFLKGGHAPYAPVPQLQGVTAKWQCHTCRFNIKNMPDMRARRGTAEQAKGDKARQVEERRRDSTHCCRTCYTCVCVCVCAACNQNEDMCIQAGTLNRLGRLCSQARYPFPPKTSCHLAWLSTELMSSCQSRQYLNTACLCLKEIWYFS